jgi:peptidoglycan/xylan/chitin deacetylase (PgdA/CDA1 family)
MPTPNPRSSRQKALAVLCMLAALLPSCASNKEKTAKVPGTQSTLPGLEQRPKPLSKPTVAGTAAPGVDLPGLTPPPSVTPTIKPSTATVNVDGIWYNSVSVNGPYIAITFDDGPSPANTPRLLDILRDQGVHATFYCVGQNVQEYPAIAQRIVNEGHEIASHSWSHPKLTGLSLEGVNSQLKKTHDAIVTATGVTPRTFRPPYGAFTKTLAAWANKEYGYKTIIWDVDPFDWKNRNASLVESRILASTKSGSIILAHDIHKTTVDAMPGTITKLKAAGYKFVTVSQLIAMGNTAPLSQLELKKTKDLVALAPRRATVPPAPYQMPRLARKVSAAPRAPELGVVAGLPVAGATRPRTNYVMLTP